MSDEHQDSKLIAIPGKPAISSETFQVTENPAPADVVNTLARLAAFMNAYMAEALRCKVISALNPASGALMHASGTLEQGSIQLRQLIQQQAGFAGGPPAQQSGPGPFRMN